MRSIGVFAAFCCLCAVSAAQQPQWAPVRKTLPAVTVSQLPQDAHAQRPVCNSQVTQRPRSAPESLPPPTIARRPQLAPERRSRERVPVTYQEPLPGTERVTPPTERPIMRVPQEGEEQAAIPACGPMCSRILLAGPQGSFILDCDGTGVATYSHQDRICHSARLTVIEPEEEDEFWVYYREEGTNNLYAIESQPRSGRQHQMLIRVRRNALSGRGQWERFQVATRHGA